MQLPAELKYTKDHEWVRINGTSAVVGITDFAQGELGDIVFVEVPSVGQEIKQGAVFGTVEAVKTVSDLYMPVSGVVAEVNAAVQKNPEKVNHDPYGEGWLIKVTLSNGAGAGLLDADQYKELIGQ